MVGGGTCETLGGGASGVEAHDASRGSKRESDNNLKDAMRETITDQNPAK
jgi:hypothetical protein